MARIKKFGVVQTSKVVAVIYFLLSAVILIPLGLLASVFNGGEFSEWEFLLSGFFIFFLPFIYGTFAFIGTAIACLIYNLISGWIGGIEVELETSVEEEHTLV